MQRKEERKTGIDYISAWGFLMILLIALIAALANSDHDYIDGLTRPTPQPKDAPQCVR